MRYALPRPEILAYPLATNVIDSVVLNSAGVAPDATGPFMNRRYLLAGTVLSKRPDNTYERFTNAANVAAANQVWTVTLVGPPTGGTFALAFEGASTGQLPYNEAAAALQTALQGLSTVGAGNMTVAGNAGGPYTITAAGTLAGEDLPNFATDGSQLTGAPNADVQSVITTRGSAAETTQNVAGILFDTVEFADGSELSDEPVAMLRRNCSFRAAAIVDFATYQAQITAGLPTCEFI
jgi:hypothetical protein